MFIERIKGNDWNSNFQEKISHVYADWKISILYKKHSTKKKKIQLKTLKNKLEAKGPK